MSSNAITNPHQYKAKVRRGYVVAGVLAVLSLIEYFVAVEAERPMFWLLPFIVLKGLAILEYFMHFSALFGGHEGSH